MSLRQTTRPSFSRTLNEILLLIPLMIGFLVVPFLVMRVCFNYYYMEKFFAVFMAGIWCVGFLAFGGLKLRLPIFSKRTGCIILALLVVLVFNYWHHQISPFSFESLQRCVFWSLALYALSYIQSIKAADRPLVFLPLFCGLGLFILGDLTIFMVIGENLPGFTFGNPNIAAEYTGICLALLLGLYHHFRLSSKIWMLEILSALSMAHIYFTNCRSAYIGVALVMVYVLGAKRLPVKALGRMLAMGTSIILLFHFSFSALHDIKTLGTILKGSSTSVRWKLVVDTLSMIKVRPLGFGLGTYEFSSVPYLESVREYLFEQKIFKSPHVEFLRFIVEDGIPAFVLMVAAFVSYGIDHARKLKGLLKSNPEVPCFAIFFLVQFFFQFPLENPFPNFMTAILLGYTVASLGDSMEVTNTGIKRCSTMFIFCILSFAVLSKFFSSYVSYLYPQRRALNVAACAIDPSQWAACLNVVSKDLQGGRLIDAERGAQEELRRRPDNFKAKGYLIHIYLHQNRQSEACALMQSFDQYFGKNSSFKDLRLKYCIKKRG